MRRFFTALGLFCALLGALLLAISFTPLVSWLGRDMAVDWYDGDADVLVVLGGSMLVDGTGPQATLGFDSYLRCVYACWNLQHHKYRYIVVSGPNGLADAMARYLVFGGSKRSQILLENAAQTTAQNAEFVKNILDRQRDLPSHPTIAVLTSDYHTRRARKVFERANIPVRMIPVPDLAKRDTSPADRWNAFLDLSMEFAKDGLYKLEGKI